MTAAATPAWFPQLLDPINDRVLLVAKTEQDYRDAAFLDERSLRPDSRRQVVDWQALAAALPGRRPPRRPIYLPYRPCRLDTDLAPARRAAGRPRPARAADRPHLPRDAGGKRPARGALGPGHPPRPARRHDVILSRTFRPGQRAMVKATSFTSESAAALVPPGSKALLLYASPRALHGDDPRRRE